MRVGTVCVIAVPHCALFTSYRAFQIFPECILWGGFMERFHPIQMSVFKNDRKRVIRCQEFSLFWQKKEGKKSSCQPSYTQHNLSFSCAEFWSKEATVTGKLDILFHNRFLPLSLFVSAKKEESRKKLLFFDFKWLTPKLGSQFWCFMITQNILWYQTPLWLCWKYLITMPHPLFDQISIRECNLQKRKPAVV